jgi:hypothetical protein
MTKFGETNDKVSNFTKTTMSSAGFGTSIAQGFPNSVARADTPIDPFVGIQHPLSTSDKPPGVSFGRWSLAVTEGLAAEWYSSYPAMHGLIHLKNLAGDEPANYVSEIWSTKRFDDSRIHPQFQRSSKTYGRQVSLTDSPLAKKIMDYMTSKAIGSSTFPVALIDGEVVAQPDSMYWNGAWQTEFGLRCFVNFEIRRDIFGVERCYLFTNLLIATRSQTHNKEISHNLVVPLSVERTMYLAENPLPSSLMSQSRSSAFPGVPEEFVPAPMHFVEDNHFGLTHYPTSDSSIYCEFNVFPHVLRVGYVITDEMQPYFEQIIPICVDALVKACTIVEDGFRNFRSPETQGSFDWGFMSEYVMCQDTKEGEVINGWSRWVPETHISPLFYTTYDYLQISNKVQEPVKRQIHQWAVDEGVGVFAVGSHANTLAYSYLIPEKSYDLALFYLDKVIRSKPPHEYANALTNSGLIYKEIGQLDNSIELLMQALDGDGMSESEASYLLGEIYVIQGNQDKAKHFYLRSMTGLKDKYADMSKTRLQKLGLINKEGGAENGNTLF